LKALYDLKCTPCRGNIPPLAATEIAELMPALPGWELLELDGVLRIEKVFKFKNFAQALAFTNQVGEIAESEGHHPALLTEWGKVTVSWWTHKIKGLHHNDFIMAAKTDHLLAA
jgi:4a-hydroxytetrahydrobiopterin dehydratase